jgi:lysozyme
MTPLRISVEALDLLKRWEGCVLHAYDDADSARPPRFVQVGDPMPGTLTIGYGHTRTVRPGQRITAAEAERLLLERLSRNELP